MELVKKSKKNEAGETKNEYIKIEVKKLID